MTTKTETAKLRAELAGCGREFSAQAYPADLRFRAAAAAEAMRARGAGWARIAGELGLAVGTVRRWCAEAEPPEPEFFAPVRVVGDGDGPALVLPSGARVVGLGPEGLAALVRALL